MDWILVGNQRDQDCGSWASFHTRRRGLVSLGFWGEWRRASFMRVSGPWLNSWESGFKIALGHSGTWVYLTGQYYHCMMVLLFDASFWLCCWSCSISLPTSRHVCSSSGHERACSGGSDYGLTTCQLGWRLGRSRGTCTCMACDQCAHSSGPSGTGPEQISYHRIGRRTCGLDYGSPDASLGYTCWCTFCHSFGKYKGIPPLGHRISLVCPPPRELWPMVT